MGGSLPRGRRAQCALGLDSHGGRPSPAHPDRPAPGLRLRHRARGLSAPRLGTLAALRRVPVLSLFSWAPSLGAVLIMFFARHRPLLVRWLALLSTGTSFVLSLGIYWAFERTQADVPFFQFYEEVPLVPPLGINYQVGVDGMSLLMVLLPSSIIFAGVFASWTVKERSQEFYTLRPVLVTRAYGVFASRHAC